MEEIRNEEVMMDENEVIDDVEVIEKKPGKLSKVISFAKKNGKKVLVGAGLIAVGIAGYALGSRGRDDDELDVDVDFDFEPSNESSEVPENSSETEE